MVTWLGDQVARLCGLIFRWQGGPDNGVKEVKGLKAIILHIWPILLMCHQGSSCGPLGDIALALLGV